MKNETDRDFLNQVVREILTGVRAGLCKFSGPSRVAVIYQINGAEHAYICDPQHLLRGHEPKIINTFFDKDDQPIIRPHRLLHRCYNMIDKVTDFELDGVISFSGQSGPVLFQMWCTDHHPEILSTGPTKRWLEHTALRFSHDVANNKELYSGISGKFLQEFAAHAVNDHIVAELGQTLGGGSRFNTEGILNAILAISKTREEHKAPFGTLVFIAPDDVETIDFLARFHTSEQPPLDNFKHVRKLLLAVQRFRNSLISDGAHILGIARSAIRPFHLSADFHGLFGFLLVNGMRTCSFADGCYSSATHQAKLVQVEEALLDYELDSSVRSSLFHIVASIVHYAETKQFGCAIVVDLKQPVTDIAGQNLDHPLDLERSNLLDLACDLARVDGALHISVDRHLHRFACLLDGPAIQAEDRARGARYNSALRFTAKNPHTIIIVVSSDRPVSIIRYGKAYTGATVARPERCPDIFAPQPLLEWLQEA